MNVELINTGSELLLGRTLNTHQQWLCRRFSDLGHPVVRQTTVADTSAAIRDAVREALGRADVVLTTGGLGPTSDDLTRASVAEMLGRSLREDSDVREHIEEIFRQRGRSMPASALVQALVPEGAMVLPNRAGTAPGLAVEVHPNPFREDRRRSVLVMLPGPPRELHPLFAASVVPLLQRLFPEPAPFVSTTLRTMGLPESMVQERIAPRLEEWVSQGLELAYCARPGEVDVRLGARGGRAGDMVGEAARVVRGLLSDSVFAEGETELEEVTVRLLAERGLTLALAESCTGGLVANRLTNISGASDVLLAGWVAYANEAKQRFLNVPRETLARHGAVSEPVARLMAEGARKAAGASLALGVTGIAGPGGGTSEKPVGTVYFALASDKGTVGFLRENRFDRLTFKQVTSQQALELVRRHVLELPLE